MELDHHGEADPIPSSRYDPVIPSSILSEKRSSSNTQAMTSLNPAAFDMSTHSPHDIFCLAKEYERQGNHADAANLYLKASMNGHLSAMVSYAHHLVQLEDQRAAFVWYRAAAERGDPRAWTELGRLLAIGRYFEVNAVDAARCWKRAAQMGDNIGKSSLGVCYVRGFGVRQDIDKGIEIMRQVAQVHNDITAMINLAWIYKNGKFVEKDLQEAEYWQRRAKQREKEMRQFSLKERALFGKGRSSRHSKSKTDVRQSTSTLYKQSQIPINPEEEDLRVKEDSTKNLAFAQDLESRLEEIQRIPEDEQLTTSENYTKVKAPDSFQSSKPVTNVIEKQFITTQEESISYQPEFREENKDKKSFTPTAIAATAAAAATAAVAVGSTSVSETIARTEAENRKIFEDLEGGEDDVKYVKEEIVRPDPDPVLKAEISQLGFKPNIQSKPITDPIQEPDFDIPESEIKRVKETAVSAIPAQKPVSFTSQPVRELPQNVDSSDNAKMDSRQGSQGSPSLAETVEDQFQTPDQSLLNEEIDSRRDLSGTATGITKVPVVDSAATRNDKGAMGYENPQHFKRSAQAAMFTHSSQPEPQFRTTSETRTGSYETQGIDTDSSILRPSGIRKTAGFFKVRNDSSPVPEASIAKDAALKSSEFVSGSSAGAQAPRDGFDVNLRGSNENLAELQDPNMAKPSTIVDNTDWTHGSSISSAVNPVPCKITKASSFAKSNALKATEFVDAPLTNEDIDVSKTVEYNDSQQTTEFVDASERSRKDEESKVSDLEELLSIYPKNPLRSDSQVPLFTLVQAIQKFPLSETDAYNTLERGNGYAKVIVAMVCQIEDEHLQEQGLHSFVRIIRATPSPQREAKILTSYADCFRTALGDQDAVIPKGSVTIEERDSGGIQAVAHAMRQHESVRRVQLAGCAALAEIASVSPSCRQEACDYGVISLVLSCLRHRSSQAASTIHDISCRAVSSFCSGKENFPFKEAFTNAGVIPELLNILQLWGHSDEGDPELMTAVTKSCCAAIRHVTDGCGVASAQCVQSFAYHHLVRVMVLRRDDVSICTLAVSALTSITRNAGSIAEKGLLDAKPLNEVLQTMQTHSQNPVFLRKSLDFMESLGNFNSMKEELVKAGGIPFSASIIQKAGNDSVLLERASGVVEKLCRTNPKNQESFASSNGVRSLTSLLRSHHNMPGVAERALLALTSVCANNPPNQREAIEANTPEYVVRVLSAYNTKNMKVAAAACSAISALVISKNAPMAQIFSNYKAPELIIEAMKKHPDSVAVQENGSAAIAGLCESDPRIIPSLQNSGITTILVVALQRFLHCQTAVVQIVRAMRAIINEACPEDSYRFKSKLLTDRSNESTLSEIFHTALSYHKKSLPDTANVIISICATINCLCMRSVAFKNEVGKDGIVEELKRLVEKTAQFRDLGALQPVLATICTLVLESEDNKNRFHEVGGVEAILDVMQKWKTDTFVLEHCCAALRYSCNDHFGNCDEAKNHNGVRSVLGVMELHPENVNVTLWCCLTLADLCKGDEELQSSPNVKQGIRTVVSAMNMFSSNSKFLASACEFLRAASVDNEDNKERIVRLGGRTAIVKALEAHPRDNALTEAGAYALLQIQDIPDPRTSVDSAQPLNIVKRFSREFRRSSSSTRSRGKEGRRSGFLGMKSRSFSRRRGGTEESNDDEENSGRGSSFMRFSRNRRRRGREEPRDEDLDDEEEEEELDDYEYEPENHSEQSEE